MPLTILSDSSGNGIQLTPQAGASGVQNIIVPLKGTFTNGRRLFGKTAPGTRLFTLSSGVPALSQDLYTSVADTPFLVMAGTSVILPTLTAGTDYAFYLTSDGVLRADTNFTAPSGFAATSSRFLGCGHYAPGGNASAQAGGNSTPAFNPYSLFDLTFRPKRKDWRGMTTDPGEGVCGMIYFLNTEHITNGPSAYNKVIADGSSPPKIPVAFGGTGSTSYSDLNYWTAAEVLSAYQMRLPTYKEFAAMAYGVTEASSIGSDQVNTILNTAYTSRCGVMQAAGVQWAWGADFGGGAASAAWTANTGGRGSTYQMENAAIFGGSWDGTSYAGSRASAWNTSPSSSNAAVAARGVCDLLILD